MSDLTRRDVLRRLAVAIAAAGTVDRVMGQEVHQIASMAAGGGPYAPKALSAHEYRTLERLTDLIIPVENGAPGAVASGAAAWIDLLASESAELKKIYIDGLAWLDRAMQQRGAKDFVSAPPAQQTALLDLIAYRRNQSTEMTPGIQFFVMARRMTVDAFYTSAIGIRDIDYRGNRPMSTYTVPQESIDYALRKGTAAPAG